MYIYENRLKFQYETSENMLESENTPVQRETERDKQRQRER